MKKGWSCSVGGFCALQNILLNKGEVHCCGCQVLLKEFKYSYEAFDDVLAKYDATGEKPAKSQGDDANASPNAKVQEGEGEEPKADSSEDGFAFARSSSHEIQAALFCSGYE